MTESMFSAISPTASLEARLARFPVRRTNLEGACVSYREAASANGETPVVLLHGIGSGAASWVQQLETLGATRRVLAWDAPGYGESTPVSVQSPLAADYVERLRGWLDVLGIARCVVIGHSLGAIIAGAFAATSRQHVAGLLLISPAAGYGAAPEAVRMQKRDARLAMLADLGPERLAERRSQNMLSPHADDASRAWVRWNMSRVTPHGYAQATHLLANADLAADLAAYDGLVHVAVGEADTITPVAACEAIARAARVPLQIIPRAGHAGYVEAPGAYDALIDAFCRCAPPQRSI